MLNSGLPLRFWRGIRFFTIFKSGTPVSSRIEGVCRRCGHYAAGNFYERKDPVFICDACRDGEDT